MYLLRSSPTFQHPDLLADFDDCLKSCATDICNVSFDDIGWIQVTLPIRMGGIGLRRASDLALPAYLASISASQSLISEIAQPDHIPLALDSCFDVWSCCCCCCRPHSTNVLPAESSTRNHVAASSPSPQVARKGSTLSGFVQRSRLEREVGRDLHSNKWEEV